MPNLHYWNSLLVLFLFLTISPNTNMENTVNQELLDAAKNVVQKVKTIQKYCKENNIDLKTTLSKEEYKEYHEALAFIKKNLPDIKMDALSLKQETKKTNDPINDIEKTPFVEALIKWKGLIKGIFTDLSTEYKDVHINHTAFGEALGASTIPIVDDLLTDWKALLETLPNDSVTAEILFSKLSKSKILASFTVANEKELKKLYKKAQNKYKDLENDIEKFQTDVLPNKALFIAAIKASTDPKDNNLPKNKEDAKKAKAAEAKAKAVEEKELLDLFKVWKKEFSAEMSKEDTLHDKNLVSLGKLKVNLPVALGYTEMYTKPIIDALSIQLKEKAFTTGDSITVKELKKHLVKITLTLDNHIDWKWQMELWRANNRGFMFPIPPAVHGAITDSELNVSEERFLDLVQEDIYKKNLSIIDTIAENEGWEKVNDPKEITFDGAILKSEFKMAFSKKIQSITPLEFVYNQLEINLKDGKISLDDFKRIWEKSIQESYQQSKNESSSVYHTWIAEHKLWHVEQALDSLAPFFPTEAIIKSVLDEAVDVPQKKARPKLHQYGNGHTTNFTCSLAWKPVESIIEVAGKEAAGQSLLTKVTEGLKSLGEGMELVIGEIENVGGPLRMNIPSFTFDVKIPMKLTQQYSSKGDKFVAAVPNNLDSSYIKFNGDSSYFGIEVLRIEPLTELPQFDDVNKYDQDSFISTQDIKLTLEILDPQVSVSLSTVAGVELAKHPVKSTVDLIFTIYSSYNLKENKVETNVKSMSHTGGGRIVKSIQITKKEKLKLEVFK